MPFSNYLTFKMRRRYQENEQPAALYDATYGELAKLAPPWGLKGIPQLPMKEHKGAVAFGVKYAKVEKTSPIKTYHLGFMNRQRSALPDDESINDDTFTVEFYPKKVQEEWRYLLDVVFPAYISASGAYCATLFDGGIYVDDVVTFNPDTGESLHNPHFVDPRKGVYRVWPANYWDRELCQRSFGLTPEQIVERLAGKVPSCRTFADGVLLIASYEPVMGEQILQLNGQVLSLLRDQK